MESITSFLSPESTERGKAAAIDAAFSSLRAAGAGAAVDEFYPKIVAAIRNKDLDEFDALGERVLGFATKNMDVPAASKEEETQVATSIEQILSTADSRNVSLPPVLVANAANAFVNKDDKTLLSLSKSIEAMLADNIQAQITEKKIPTRLDDDSVVIIGETTKTRYDPTNAPIPSGNNNTELFSRFAEQAFASTRDAMAGIPGIGSVITTQFKGVPVVPATQAGQVDIGARPEAYASMERPALGTIEQREEARAKVRRLYLSGDREGALDKLNSIPEAKGLFGGDYTMTELDVIYSGELSNEKKKERPSTKNKEERPPLDNFFGTEE